MKLQELKKIRVRRKLVNNKLSNKIAMKISLMNKQKLNTTFRWRIQMKTKSLMKVEYRMLNILQNFKVIVGSGNKVQKKINSSIVLKILT